MVWSAAALTTVQLARHALDLPILVSGSSATYSNAVKNLNAVPQWRTSGSWSSGTDVAHASFPTTRLYSDDLTEISKPTATAAVMYLLFDLANVAFDVVAIVTHNVEDMIGGPTLSVTVQISDAADFSTIHSVATWTDPSKLRLVSCALTSGRYSGVRYMRIRIESDGGLIPEIGQVFLGTRQSLPHRPNRGSYDPDHTESRFGVYEAGGLVRRHPRYTGRRIVDAEWSTDSTTYEALFRDWFAGCSYGTRPSLWIPNPSTAPRSAYWMRTDPILRIDNTAGARAGRVSLSLRELPPFVTRELA